MPERKSAVDVGEPAAGEAPASSNWLQHILDVSRQEIGVALFLTEKLYRADDELKRLPSEVQEAIALLRTLDERLDKKPRSNVGSKEEVVQSSRADVLILGRKGGDDIGANSDIQREVAECLRHCRQAVCAPVSPTTLTDRTGKSPGAVPVLGVLPDLRDVAKLKDTLEVMLEQHAPEPASDSDSDSSASSAIKEASFDPVQSFATLIDFVNVNEEKLQAATLGITKSRGEEEIEADAEKTESYDGGDSIDESGSPEAQLIELRTRRNALQEQERAITQKLHKVHNLFKRTESSSEAHAKRLQNELDRVTEENEKLRQEIDDSIQRRKQALIDQVEQEGAHLQTSTQQLTEQLGQAASRHDSIEADLQKQLDDTLKQLQELMQHYDKKMLSLLHERRALNEELAVSGSEYEKLKALADELEERRWAEEKVEREHEEQVRNERNQNEVASEVLSQMFLAFRASQKKGKKGKKGKKSKKK